jgi:hypothetical protein
VKENVIIGRLIPAGTGSDIYSEAGYADLTDEENSEPGASNGLERVAAGKETSVLDE